jgi:hypothetical protein
LLERNTPPLREIARITDIERKTIHSHHSRWKADSSNSPGVATGSKNRSEKLYVYRNFRHQVVGACAQLIPDQISNLMPNHTIP